MTTTNAAAASAVRGMRADARRNRDRILAAAREAFAEYGSETQMDDIARRAGAGVEPLPALPDEGRAHQRAREDQARRLRGAGAGEVRGRRAAVGVVCRSPARADRADGGRRLSAAHDLRDDQGSHAAGGAHRGRAREATQKLIDRAQAAVSCAPTSWSTTFAPRCGLGSAMAADAVGVMPYDWRRMPRVRARRHAHGLGIAKP